MHPGDLGGIFYVVEGGKKRRFICGMAKTTSSSHAMVWAAVLMLLAGGMTGSPAGRFFAGIVAALLALFPACTGRSWRRLFAVLIFVLAAVCALGNFGDYQEELARSGDGRRVERGRVEP
jgi:hypothetical protein